MIETFENSEHSKKPARIAAIPYVLPFVLFVLIGAFEPQFLPNGHSVGFPEIAARDGLLAAGDWDAQSTRWYVLLLWIKFVLVGASLVIFRRTYVSAFPWATDRWAVVAGIVGAGVWIGICWLAIEPNAWTAVGLDRASIAVRSHFDPSQRIDTTVGRVLFFTARIGLLTLVIPLAEEIFLRGLLMRVIQSSDWTRVDLRNMGWPALVAGSVYGLIAHPQEGLAALIWFSLISWLMVRTGKFWNCVVAHAITNGLLGAYVVVFRQWQLW